MRTCEQNGNHYYPLRDLLLHSAFWILLRLCRVCVMDINDIFLLLINS